MLCSSARHFTLTVSVSAHIYKWVLVNLMLGVILGYVMDKHAIDGGVKILLVTVCY